METWARRLIILCVAGAIGALLAAYDIVAFGVYLGGLLVILFVIVLLQSMAARSARQSTALPAPPPLPPPPPPGLSRWERLKAWWRNNRPHPWDWIKDKAVAIHHHFAPLRQEIRSWFIRPPRTPTPPPAGGATRPPHGVKHELHKIIAAIAVIVALYVLTRVFENPVTYVVRYGLLTWFGIMVALFIIPLIPPLMDKLKINPNANRPPGFDPNAANIGRGPHYPVSRRGFFTDMQPGRVKNRETWEGSFIDSLMDYDERKYEGELPTNNFTPDMQGYWRVIKTPQGEQDSHPLPFPAPKGTADPSDWWLWLSYSPFSITWWAWKRYTYRLRGAVWVGIPGFRTLHMFAYERYVVATSPDGTTRTLQRRWDWSDHARVAQFEFPLLVASAETQNMIEFRGFLNGILRTENPYILAYNTNDQWPHRLAGAIATAFSTYVRGRTNKQVTPNEASVEVQHLLQAEVEHMGLAVEGMQVPDITPTDRAVARRLAEPELALADKDAAILRAEGNAANIRKSGEALWEFQDVPGVREVAIEEVKVRQVEAAAEGEDTTIFFGVQGPTPVLDIAEERDRRQQRRARRQPGPQQGPQPGPQQGPQQGP